MQQARTRSICHRAPPQESQEIEEIARATQEEDADPQIALKNDCGIAA
jgi:hypothetical protein